MMLMRAPNQKAQTFAAVSTEGKNRAQRQQRHDQG